MFIIPIQELDAIVNDNFGNGAKTQSTNDEAELQERADYVDEERDDPPDWEK